MRIAIAGASGRMGQTLVQAVLASDDTELVLALDHPDSAAIGVDAAAFLGKTSGVRISHDIAALGQAECLIDFTRPEGTLAHLRACSQHGVNMVIGTTGMGEAGAAAIRAGAEHIGIVYAPNMSVGMNATFKLLDVAARILNSGFDAEVFEAHHRNKVDAPSGTAIRMGEIVAQAWDAALPEVATWSREGHTGPRQPGTIGFSVVRGGDIVGEHTVYFCGEGERIEITHRSNSRQSYADGSLRAARFLQGKSSGLHDMADVLGW
jgi:4-hydroxy-tetrahydrodipicolinate reductase